MNNNINISNNNNGNNIDPNSKKKITRGRQKIQIKKLEDKNSLQVTFSKRRSGLFSKAMELCVLCGAEVGIIVFSPNGKIFLAGHPDFDKILNRYLDQNHSSLDEVNTIPCVQQHNKEYEDAMQELEKEKKRGKMIEEEKKKNKSNGRFWWQEGNIIDDMGIEELEEYLKAMKKLKGKVEMRVNEIMMNGYLAPNMNLGNDHRDAFGNINVNVNEDISVCGGIDGGVDFDFGFDEHFN